MKTNEATVHRPQGDRIIDAPYVFIKLPELISQLKTEEAWQKNDRNAISVFKTGNVSMVLVCLHAKAILKDNIVDGIFTIQVIEGLVRINNYDGDMDLGVNNIMTFHQLVDHSVEALTESVLLLTNYSMH